jgi:hypothetical protein
VRWRKYILRALLVSLGLAALAGVASVFVTNYLTWRIAGTGIATAIASLLLLPMTMLLDRPHWAESMLAAAVVVVLEYLLTLGLVWAAYQYLPGSWDEEELLISMGFVVLGGLPAIVFLRFRHVAVAKIASVAGLVFTGLFLAFSFAGTWLPRWLVGNATGSPYYEIREDLWATSWILGVFGLLATMAIVNLGHDRRHWRWAGVACSAVTAWLVLMIVWTGGHLEERLVTPLVCTASFVAFANLVVLVKLPGGQQWLVRAVIICGAVTALSVTAVSSWPRQDLLERLAAASAIVTGCATLAMAVLARLNRRIDVDALPPEFSEITLFCPACRKKQTLPLGGAACSGCGLRLQIEAVVPRCSQCGYLLYHLQSSRCPECGAG